MSGQTFILAIIFMVIVVPSLVKLILSYRERSTQSRVVEEAQQANTEMSKRLEELEERVRVLERIVTDERYELRQRFRELGG